MKTAFTNIVNGLMAQDALVTHQLPPLSEQLEQAKQEWHSAQNYYNNVSDADLVDHAAYLIQAAEKKYTYLLKRARNEGVRYAPFN
ncbi:YaaL family protein [Sporomusa malonica]|uniref:DUF2508 domain-containing protein n=1 Tax=Sporomusa malonica TaxID=112901 RepID=A0A1W2CN20_9FIRM|nr:YaaL family protein [Sporomusa malonica]SMC86613.1 Protein of unknown function [Sporomusa malonica]